MVDIAVVFLCAGLSSRFGGLKQFAQVGPNGESLIEYSVNEALQAGFSKIVFIVGEKTADVFKEKFGDLYRGTRVLYAFQKFNEKERDRPWGTVDALCALKGVIECPFVINNGDDIYGQESYLTMVNHLKNKKEVGTVGYDLIKVLPEKGEVNRGIFDVGEDGYVKNIKEVFGINRYNFKGKGLSVETKCSMNFYGFQPEILDKMREVLKDFKEKHKGNRKIECLLPQELGNLVKKGVIKVKLYSTIGKFYGVTNPEDELAVRKALSK
jgi:NDP-sugar pyrophosphorylase family protein